MVSDTVIEQSNRNVNRCNDNYDLTSKILNTQNKPEQVIPEKSLNVERTTEIEIMNMTTSTSNYEPLPRNIPEHSSGANHNGSHRTPIPPTQGQTRESKKTYTNTAKTNLPVGTAQNADQKGHKYNHKQNNRGTFDNFEEGPKMVRKDYATFPDGNLKWVEHWVPAKNP